MKFEYIYIQDAIQYQQRTNKAKRSIGYCKVASSTSFFQVAGSLSFFPTRMRRVIFCMRFRNVFAQRRDKQKRLFAVRNYLLGTECLIPVTFLTPPVRATVYHNFHPTVSQAAVL
jgi:hypothetical protein